MDARWPTDARPEPVVKTIWTLRWMLRSVVPLLIALFYLSSLFRLLVGFEGYLVFVAVTVTTYIVIIRLFAHLYYRRYRYSIFPDRLMVEKGILILRTAVVPYDRIQNVNVHRRILERLFHVGNIAVQTAGRKLQRGGSRAQPAEIVIDGVRDAEALAEWVFQRARTTTGKRAGTAPASAPPRAGRAMATKTPPSRYGHAAGRSMQQRIDAGKDGDIDTDTAAEGDAAVYDALVHISHQLSEISQRH